MTDPQDRVDSWGHTPRYYVRLGKLTAEFERLEQQAYVSRMAQVAATWRSAFGWRLARALGWAPAAGLRGVRWPRAWWEHQDSIRL